MPPSPSSRRPAALERQYPFHLTPCPPRDYIELLRPVIPGIAAERPKMLHCGCRYGEIALSLSTAYPIDILATEEDTEGLLFARMVSGAIRGPGSVQFRFMTPLHLDVPDGGFDLVLLDGILATQNRRKILREAARVLAPGGRLIVFESYWLKTPPPPFVAAVWDSAGHKTTDREGIRALVEEAGFTVTRFMDMSKRLDSFYSQFSEQVRDIAAGGFEGMKHRKSLVKQYKHEIDVYRKNGGSAFMGYCGIVASGTPSAVGTDVPPGSEEETPPTAGRIVTPGGAVALP